MTSKRSLFGRLVPCRCLRGEEEAVTSLDYSHCSLEQVPKEIFGFEKTLEELYLDANQIEELPKQLFNCQSLNRLSLPDNDLTVLPAGIANLANLRELDISKNSIQEFPENIKNCKVLTIVEASVNPISKLPEGFTQLLNLTQLYLNDAFLEFLPASFGRLTKLQILELRENQLKMLPKSMQKLTQLERLDLGSNEFTEVPEVLEQLTGIRELWLDGNRLTFLPGMLGSLKQLSYLDVSKNNVEMLDEQISGCENLQDLLLSHNALTQLPGSIGSLKKLTALKVDENQLMYLPDSIGGLAALEELDCSLNEIEALPPSMGQCINLRTFAADHNFLAQLPPEVGSWKNLTVLFLHSNKLESLPEEMGEMQKLKVINLSDNKLKNLPFNFTKLNQLTAMWLSENQSKPLIPLQKEEDPETHKTVLTNYMFPQQPRTEDYTPTSDNESFNPSLWEEQRKQRAQVAFECDEDTDRRDMPPREGNLKRYPTPYPDELKNMVKTAQSIATRLREDESGDESGRESKASDRAPTGVRDMGVKVVENTCANGKPVEADLKATMNSLTGSVMPEPGEEEVPRTQNTPLIMPENPGTVLNHEDALEGSEELSSEDDEMKVAEMRPPLIEISINQPKVLVLGKDKKEENRDADSLLDDTVANSNQNNSNCSSPSRMSDSVSLTTDSSQDMSLCTPEREARLPFLAKSGSRQEDENQNQLRSSEPPLQNGSASDTLLQALLKGQPGSEPRLGHMAAFDVAMEEKLSLLRDIDLNSRTGDKWDHINRNVMEPTDNFTRAGDPDKAGDLPTPNNNTQPAGALENGNRPLVDSPGGGTRSLAEVRTAAVGVTAGGEAQLSRSTEELSPQKRAPPTPVVKSQSVTNMEMGGMKLYGIESDGGLYEAGPAGRGPAPGAQGQSIVRSKSASLLSDQPLQVYPSTSASSSDLMLGSRMTTARADPAGPRGPLPASMQQQQQQPPPQYNIQYTSSAMSKDGLWALRMPMPPEQAYLPPQHLLANTNYSNRNHAPPYPLQPLQRGLLRPTDLRPVDRMLPPRGPLQRQPSTSSSSAVSMSLQDPRRVAVPEGDYLTYREIHTAGRGLAPMTQAGPRPLSARTYSVDGPGMPRPHSARPPTHEVPERTMSVTDFNYQQVSPSKRPNVRVKSEHSLLEGPGTGRVPADWRDQVMRHIEAKKMEKQEDVFGLPGPQGYTMDTLRKVPLPNGQVCPPPRPPMSCGPAPMARHPSREQLIDYLKMKVSQQAQGPPRSPLDLVQQEVHVQIEKNPELGFSISGGLGGRGNPFRPEDHGIFVTRVQPEGPASKLLQPGDKIIQANGYNFVNIDHGYAVSLLKTFPSTVDLIIVREMSA